MVISTFVTVQARGTKLLAENCNQQLCSTMGTQEAGKEVPLSLKEVPLCVPSQSRLALAGQSMTDRNLSASIRLFSRAGLADSCQSLTEVGFETGLFILVSSHPSSDVRISDQPLWDILRIMGYTRR
jgi:hypothetical protein